MGTPGFSGYALNVVGQGRQPVQISQIYSGSVAYPIAGTTTTIPFNFAKGKAVPFSGSISHGLDKQLTLDSLTSADGSEQIPRTTVPQTITSGLFGGDGLGGLIGTSLSLAFQGSGAIPPATSTSVTPGTTMKGDDPVFYTVNLAASTTMDSTGKSGAVSGGQYFVDETDPDNPIYGVVSLPKFTFNTNNYTVNLSTTDPVTSNSRYTLVVGQKSYPFGPDNAHVTVDRTTFTFNPLAGGAYTVTYAAADSPADTEAPSPIALTPFTVACGGVSLPVDVFNDEAALTSMALGPIGRTYTYDPKAGTVIVTAGATTTTAQLQTGLVFASASAFGYVIGIEEGAYTVNGDDTFSYSASTTGEPAAYPLQTAPQIFTLGGTFYTFDQKPDGTYQSVTGGGQVILINNNQFSINGQIYVIDTNVQPNTVMGGGNTYPMTDQNTQFEIDGVPYTITLKSGSLAGGSVSGQFDITQGNVVVIEDFVYLLDTLNSQVVGNGSAYPLTTSGVTYDVTTAGRSFTVTAEPNETTVTIANVDYVLGSSSVVADGVTYPILVYRSFIDGGQSYDIGLDGTVSTETTFPLAGGSFTDGATYETNLFAAFDGTTYYPMSGTPAAFTTPSHTYTVRTDGVAFLAGPAKTYLAPSGAPSPHAFAFGTETISFGRPTDLAAFDGTEYYAIANNEFTDTNTGTTFTLSGNTAISGGSSYEIFSNLGATPYFEVPDGATYQVNLPVADTGSASGDLYNVFPVTSGSFTMPVKYELTASGSTASVQAVTFGAAAVAVPSLTALGGSLTGGYFTDPVTAITYTVVVNGSEITVVDSSNTIYAFGAEAANTFVANVVVQTAVTLAVDNEATPAVFPVANNQFVAADTIFQISIPVAATNAATGPYFPITNGRFVVPGTPPSSDVTYTISGSAVRRGYVLDEDDQFSADGKVTYTVNEVNVVRTSSTPALSGSGASQKITDGTVTYALGTTPGLATTTLAGVTFDQPSGAFTVAYPGGSVTYKLAGAMVTDSRTPTGHFPATISGSTCTFVDTSSGVTFSFDDSGDNPVTAGFVYENGFFVDATSGTTYLVDTTDKVVNAISYLPETTAYGFTPPSGITYLIHFHDVEVVFPVISGANVNVGVATVGDDTFDVHVDEVVPLGGGSATPTNPNSFEINGNRYSIVGTPNGADYSGCSVVGDGMAPVAFASPTTFTLSDPSITYTLKLDAENLPAAVSASFPVQASRDVISVADDVYVISYATTTTGNLLGQGQSRIPIASSSFTLTNRIDASKATFTFADLDIYDASAVIGKFPIYAAPTFEIGSTTYTLDTANAVVRDSSKRPYPLVPNPQMFSIAGANYVIDTNQVPHAIVGNQTVSPLQTDVTVESGAELANSTFPLGGQIYRYVEDGSQNLLAVTGTKLYPIAQPQETFKLDSSLVFTLSTTPPASGNYPGTDVPIGTVTAGTAVVANVFAGRPESGGSAFFVYKGQLYTLVESEGKYVAIQKTATVYASRPASTQQQLAVFDLAGWTYLVTDGTTSGAASPAGINPGTLWSEITMSATEASFGVVYGFGVTPTTVTATTLPSGDVEYQFAVAGPTGIGTATATTLYDVVYQPRSATNQVRVDVPALLPAFTETAEFTFTTAYPLSLETGGYNAFTTFVDETSLPAASFAAAFRTPVTSFDSQLDDLMSPQGDFSVEFWHSIPSTTPAAYHPFTYQSSGAPTAGGAIPPVNFIDVDFENASNIYLQVNETVLQANVVPPVFSSRWQHLAISYTQPYVMVFRGAPFEVKNGNNYNVAREFSIAFTFSVEDANTTQGLVYKGTGSPITAPEYTTSYSVYLQNGAISLEFADGLGNPHSFQTPVGSIEPNTFYDVVISKRTASPLGDGSDPYAPPFDPADIGTTNSQGFSTHADIPSGSGTLSIKNIAQTDTSSKTSQLITSIGGGSASKQTIAVEMTIRPVFADGSTGTPTTFPFTEDVDSPAALQVLPTGKVHVLIGTAYDDQGTEHPLGNGDTVGNIRDVYIFGSAINPTGIATSAGVIPITQATSEQLLGASICGYWKAAYDPNNVVQNPVNADDIAVTTNALLANLLPLAGRELEGTSLFVNGAPMTLSGVYGAGVPSSLTGKGTGSYLSLNAGRYKLQEISIWQMARQQYQVIDDMFGRLVIQNEPTLVLYLSGSFTVPTADAPPLPLKKFVDQLAIKNEVSSNALVFSPASIDLAGSPAVGRCGPLITPNLYTPPGAALTVADTPPTMTTYSVTLNGTTGTLAGEINEVYAYLADSVLMLYAGKKVGDLVLSWVGQQQGKVQLIGYVEGAPPAPAANLTNKSSYAGATSVTFAAATSVSMKYQSQTEEDWSDALKLTGDAASVSNAANATATAATTTGAEFQIKVNISPMGAGVHTPAVKVNLEGKPANLNLTWTGINGTTKTSSEKLDEQNRYVVRLEGAMAPYTGDPFMAGLNTASVPSTTPGVPASRSPILPDPNVGGFTTSNPPGALPKTAPTEERFGQRMFLPSPYGQAFVTSQTEDVYQETLLQTNTVYGFVHVPNTQIPRDINIVSFRMSSKYLRPGSLDGFVDYGYRPATLPSGQETFTTSSGELVPLVDGNFESGDVGHNASYMRVVEAYTLKRQIDQEAFDAFGIYNTKYGSELTPLNYIFSPPDRADGDDAAFTPALDFYNEYIWSARGGTQEVRHTYQTSYEEVLTSSTGFNWDASGSFDIKLTFAGVKTLDLGIGYAHTDKASTKWSYTSSGSKQFDITCLFDGIEADTQMRYASANDAHFVMRNNSMYNPNNESGLNLVIGSDGLVYNIVPSVTSGAGLPMSDDIDTTFGYTQPQPSYTTGNADGLSGALEPYDRPGKTSQFRSYAFFLQPSASNGDDFWSTVVDPVWLANSPDPDAAALRPVQGAASMPWRTLYRVTYTERYLPPVSADVAETPAITPLMAVPVIEPASDFLYAQLGAGPSGSARNPLNDIEANVVLVAPTTTGQSAGTTQTSGPNTGQPIPPNNVIPFDLVKTAASIVSWGDSANNKLLSGLITSALGQSAVPMSRVVLPGSTLIGEIENPEGGMLYSSYLDPNGIVVNVSTDPAATVFQDVNGNPISFYDGNEYRSLQADYVAAGDGTILYYVQPPSTYDPSNHDLLGDYDLLGRPGDEWRYFLVSGTSADMTSDQTVAGSGPFLVSNGSGASYTGFTVATSQHDDTGANQVEGYLVVRGVLEWPTLNVNAETFADVSVYKSMSLLDTFPIGDPGVLRAFLTAAYPTSTVAGNAEIAEVFSRNIVSYFNTTQQALIPQ